MSFNGEVTRRYFVDEKTVTFVNVQDVEPILDLNAEERSEEQSGDIQKFARIPNTKLLEWFYAEHAKGNTSLRMNGEEWDRLVWKKLQDPDNKNFLTRKPKLIIHGASV